MVLYKNNFRIGFWVIYILKYLDRFPIKLRHLLSFIFVLELTISLGLWLFYDPLFKWLFLPVIGLYFMVNFYFSIKIAHKTNWNKLFLLPFIFTCRHLPYGFGSFSAILYVIISREFWRNRFHTSEVLPFRD